MKQTNKNQVDTHSDELSKSGEKYNKKYTQTDT